MDQEMQLLQYEPDVPDTSQKNYEQPRNSATRIPRRHNLVLGGGAL